MIHVEKTMFHAADGFWRKICDTRYPDNSLYTNIKEASARQMKKRSRFFILCCTVGWVIAGIAILLGLRDIQETSYTVFTAIYMLLPGVFAVIL